MTALPQPGQVLAGKYCVERVLGIGGHGVVVAAQHIGLGERVAIKVLRSEYCEDPETIARFLREARAAVRIRGEHVTRVLDVGSNEDGTPFMVMEHLEGADLATVLERNGPMPVNVAVDYILQACEALAEAHAMGIVHRDIKPSNLFLTTRPDGTPCVKLLDFGISKLTAPVDMTPELALTQTQTVLGSPQYMAPEQMRSSRQVDARTDIWALGTTLFEFLAGRPPFNAASMAEMFAMILQDPTPPIRQIRPDVPEAVEIALNRCLEKRIEDRFGHVAELAHVLGTYGSNVGAITARRISLIEQRTNERRSMPSITPSVAPPPPTTGVLTAMEGPTIRTAPPSTRMRSKLVAVLAGVVAVLVASILAVVFARRDVIFGPKAPDAAASVATELPSAFPTGSSSALTGATNAPTTMPPSSATSPSTASESAGVNDPAVPGSANPLPRATGGKKPRPAHSASAPATVPAPPATTPAPRPTGIASSRYD